MPNAAFITLSILSVIAKHLFFKNHKHAYTDKENDILFSFSRNLKYLIF
jgi:hypothetical protein